MKNLWDIAIANRAGTPVGIPAYCTVQPETLRAIIATYAADQQPVLIEASSAAVNQFGGYSGMTPAGFRNFIDILAAGEGVDSARVILGAARLGPHPWRGEPAAIAMDKASALVRAAVEAGFTKLHFDAASPCADDGRVTEAIAAARAAQLCAVAEATAGGRALSYVIGTSKAVPNLEGAVPEATTRAEAHRTFELYETAFADAGVGAALERVVGVLVDPGCGFGNAAVTDYDPAQTLELADAILDVPNAAFEAPAADYQSEAALRAMVGTHFAILKVGPELTTAFRRAVVAMAHIESHLDVRHPSDILERIEAEMTRDPEPWLDHIRDDRRARTMRLFGQTDRLRHYWSRPAIAPALQRLFANVDGDTPEIGLVEQYAPPRHPETAGRQPLSTRIIGDHVGAVVDKLRRASGAA